MSKQIVLASASPRRHELLKEIFKDFEVDISTKEEKKPFYVSVKNMPMYLAKQKAKDVFKRHTNDIVIGADTIVYIDHKALGKPKDYNDAKRMISLLSNRTHEVITGVCIMSKDNVSTFKVISKVAFRKITPEEIDKYCSLKTIYDKAGAYAIQGEAKDFVINVEGEYNNIVGLPTKKLKEKLKEHSII